MSRLVPARELVAPNWRFVVAPGVEPAAGCLEALEAARDRVPGAVLLAAHVPGDEAWPRVLDKEDAIDACRHGLVALRAVEPGVLLARTDVPSFVASAVLLGPGHGYLVPEARAARTGPAPRVPLLELLRGAYLTREEKLWQLFRLARRAGRGGPRAASRRRGRTGPT